MIPESENNKKLKDFFGKEYNSLIAYVNSRIKASASRDAEDIIQDVALKLFSVADRYSPINNVASFVYHSIKNKIIDVMRGVKRSDNREDITEVTDFTTSEEDVSDEHYSERMKEELKKTILSLKPNYRDIIIAIDFEGRTYKEISHKTGIPIGTLMSRRHRAISLLYKKLKIKI